MDDLQEACGQLEKAQGTRLSQREGMDTAMGVRGPRNFEMKWAGPDEVVLVFRTQVGLVQPKHVWGTVLCPPNTTLGVRKIRCDGVSS